MTDIKSPALLYAKGFLLLLTGGIAAGLLLAEAPSLKVAALLAITVWCCCRSYYFAFYVIEHYQRGEALPSANDLLQDYNFKISS